MAKIYIEGGGDSKELHTRCREGFRHLLENCGYQGRMPRLVACGGRSQAYDAFQTAVRTSRDESYIALLVDSETAVKESNKTWAHLRVRDNWPQPKGTNDEQVLLMVTCMETWVVADRPALRRHFGSELNESALPPLHGIENRSRDAVLESLTTATKDCQNAYRKGKRSFELIAKIRRLEIEPHLTSFQRFLRILDQRL